MLERERACPNVCKEGKTTKKVGKAEETHEEDGPNKVEEGVGAAGARNDDKP